MVQKEFAGKVRSILENDPTITGLAAAGSWITDELDDYSDLDLILVTTEKVGGDKEKMIQYANRFGSLLSAFTGEHVGEPKLLICLYENPLLHVDLKFVTIDEFRHRVENPVLLLDKEGELQKILNETQAVFPHPDYQWIEDRFWIWVHYGLLKTGRGEYMEALDFLAYLRMMVLGPLLHIKNGNLPRGVRKIELLPHEDYQQIAATIGAPDKNALIAALENAISLYKALRQVPIAGEIHYHTDTEQAVLRYLQELKHTPD